MQHGRDRTCRRNWRSAPPTFPEVRRALVRQWIGSIPNPGSLPAALVDYWKTILVGLVAISGAIGTILRVGFRPLRSAWSRIRQATPARSLRPLRFVQVEAQSFWGPARRGDEQGTQIAGHWHVTNISDQDVVLLRVRLDGYQSDFGNVATEGLDERLYSSTFPVRAHCMASVTVNLMYFPAIHTGRAPLVADVFFTDNYENEHRARAAKFRFVGP